MHTSNRVLYLSFRMILTPGTLPRVFNLEIPPDQGPIYLVVICFEPLDPRLSQKYPSEKPRMRVAFWDGKYEQQMVVVYSHRKIERGDMLEITNWTMMGWEIGKNMVKFGFSDLVNFKQNEGAPGNHGRFQYSQKRL